MDIIFDLDGTLWDSTETATCAWNEVFERNNLRKIVVEELQGVMGLDLPTSLKVLHPDCEISLVDQIIAAEAKHFKDVKLGIYDNVAHVIKQLSKDHRLFIVSNCQSGYIDLFLDAFDLRRYFTDYLCWEDTLAIKGETIQLLMARNSIVDTCYVGDTSGDKAAAEYARIPFIYAAYGFGKVVDCERKIADISALPALITALR